MNTGILLFIVIIALVLFLFLTGGNESFWGGYFPTPYMGQKLTCYGRSGVNAATDACPTMIVNPDACNVSPYYCERCKGYRCCCR